MFKIVSILNGHSAVPETVKLPVSASMKFTKGAALTLLSGKASACTATTKPTFITAHSRSDSSTTLLAYPITEDIILECPVSEDPSSLKVGQKVTLTFASGQAVGVTATTEGGVATIYDLQGASAIGDYVLVRIVN